MGNAVSAESVCESESAGVELPPGCKDLMDVLKMETGQRGESASFSAVWPIERGRLSDVEGWLAKFSNSEAFVKGLFVSCPQRGFLTHLVARPSGEFLVSARADSARSGLKAKLQSSFPGQAMIEMVHGKEFIAIQMSADSFEAAAGMMMDVLGRGCGVTEEDRLTFVMTERGDGGE